ncbi:MAG: ABC transporter permease, partial [Vicinamibacteria bacterium]
VFSLIDALLFRPFPIERPEDLVSLGSGREEDPSGVSWPDFDDLRRIQEPLSGLAAHAAFTFSVRAPFKEASTERLGGALVSSNYFDVLGVVPRNGRGFLEAEDEKPTPVAIVSHRLWRSRFGEDPGVLGKILRVNGHDLTIVGVAPPGFHGTSVDQKSELWVPLAMLPELWPGMMEFFAPRDQAALGVIGRLKPGLSLEKAEAAMKAHAKALEQAYPDTNTGATATLAPLSETRLQERDSTVSYLLIVLGIVAMVFLIAVTNVAGLRLIDLKDRETEIALRRAIGASVARLWRQFLVENLLIYSAAFAMSLVVAFGTIHVLERLSLFRMALSDVDLRLDPRALGAALAVALAGALAGSLVPLVASRSVSLSEKSGRLASGGARLRGGFLVAQFELSSALLVGA